MRYGARTRALGCVVAALAAVLTGAGALAVTDGHAAPALKDVVFAPHRAVYELSLDGTRSGSSVTGVNGRIVYELSGNACEGYAQSMRFVTQTVNQDGNLQTTDLRTSSWEEVPAKRLRFSTSTYQNEIQAEQTQADPGQAGPEPPLLAVVLEPSVERQQGDEPDQPEGGADLDGAHAVDVQGLDVRDEERPLAELVLHRLVVAKFHGCHASGGRHTPRYCRP